MCHVYVYVYVYVRVHVPCVCVINSPLTITIIFLGPGEDSDGKQTEQPTLGVKRKQRLGQIESNKSLCVPLTQLFDGVCVYIPLLRDKGWKGDVLSGAHEALAAKLWGAVGEQVPTTDELSCLWGSLLRPLIHPFIDECKA